MALSAAAISSIYTNYQWRIENVKLFISWSGKLSKEVAKALKCWLTDSVFPMEKLDVFFSEDDIGSGLDWLQVTKG
jgi:hypothetical protein